MSPNKPQYPLASYFVPSYIKNKPKFHLTRQNVQQTSTAAVKSKTCYSKAGFKSSHTATETLWHMSTVNCGHEQQAERLVFNHSLKSTSTLFLLPSMGVASVTLLE